MKTTDRNGDVIAAKAVSDADDLMMITDKGQVVRIRIREISVLGRNTQGVILVRTKDGEKVVACQNLAENEVETEGGESGSGEGTPESTPQA
jgi:DNA gyrase subunit A